MYGPTRSSLSRGCTTEMFHGLSTGLVRGDAPTRLVHGDAPRRCSFDVAYVSTGVYALHGPCHGVVHYVGDGGCLHNGSCPKMPMEAYTRSAEDQYYCTIYHKPSMRHEPAHSVAVTAASATRTGASRRTSRTYQRRGARWAQLSRSHALFGCRLKRVKLRGGACVEARWAGTTSRPC